MTAGTTPHTAALVQVRDLAKTFDVSAPWLNRVIERMPRQFVHAVDGVSFSIEKGKTLALVGESGCGKSTVARLLVGLLQPTRGEVRFDGQATDAARDAGQLRQLRHQRQHPRRHAAACFGLTSQQAARVAPASSSSGRSSRQRGITCGQRGL